MAKLNMVQAINLALDEAMAADETVVVLGEDVGYFGGVFRCTDGLQRKYGEHRVIDAPIAEGGIIGAAIGMGLNGLRPVAEIQFADYIYPGFDQVCSELSRLRYRSDGPLHAARVWSFAEEGGQHLSFATSPDGTGIRESQGYRWSGLPAFGDWGRYDRLELDRREYCNTTSSIAGTLLTEGWTIACLTSRI